MKREEALEQFDRVRFRIYKTYGLGTFYNHLIAAPDTVERQEVVDLVKLPHVRPLMEEYIASLETKIREAISILEDADGS